MTTRSAPAERRVPLLDLKAQYQTIRTDIDAAIARVVESQYFILGPEVAAFEREAAAYCECALALGLSSGTDALLLALMAFDIQPGDEIITTPFSFFATAGVIARLRARPVFVDIDPLTFNMDASAAVACIGERTRAIIPVHLYGRVAELDALVAAGLEQGIPVIEDAAQAIGARDEQGRQAGSIGDVGCFSFFPSKNLGAFGDAGMVTTRNADLDRKMRLLRVHGGEPKYYHSMIGGNFRIDALQAAVLRVKLPHLDSWSAARRHNAARYRELFAQAGLTGRITLPADVPGHIYNQFVIRVGQRDALRAHLEKRGVGTEIYYPVPLHLQECFRDLGYQKGAFPHTERAAAEVLALPIYPELSEDDLAYVVDCCAEFMVG